MAVRKKIVGRMIRMQADHPRDSVIIALNKHRSLSDFILEFSFCILSSCQQRKKTSKGFLISRKDARKIIANKVKIDKLIFSLIISEMRKRGFVEISNRGIYIKSEGETDV